MFARQDQVQGDAHKEGFMELSKIATRHISRSIFSDQVTWDSTVWWQPNARGRVHC